MAHWKYWCVGSVLDAKNGHGDGLMDKQVIGNLIVVIGMGVIAWIMAPDAEFSKEWWVAMLFGGIIITIGRAIADG
jgi:hypothetical protein